ncbi:hypothetical protein AIZ12_25925, partial [Salmonella enterica subsp. enterica serovar Typhimurium]
MTANDQIQIVFLDGITQHLAQIAATAQGFSDRVASVGRQLGQRVEGIFGDTYLHNAKLDVKQTGL